MKIGEDRKGKSGENQKMVAYWEGKNCVKRRHRLVATRKEKIH